MLDQLLIGSSFTGALVYLLVRTRIYFRCDDPIVIIDSNDNEITVVSDEYKDVVVINKKKAQNICI